METAKRTTLSVLLLTWINMGVLLVKFALSLRHEDATARSARTIAETPIVFPASRSSVTGVQETGRPASVETGASVARATVLDAEQMARVVKASHVDSRVRMRTVAVLQALHRIEQRRELRTLDRATRALIVTLARESTRQRALLEFELATEQMPDLPEWDRRIESLDDGLRRDVVERLQGTLDRAELELTFRTPARRS